MQAPKTKGKQDPAAYEVDRADRSLRYGISAAENGLAVIARREECHIYATSGRRDRVLLILSRSRNRGKIALAFEAFKGNSRELKAWGYMPGHAHYDLECANSEVGINSHRYRCFANGTTALSEVRQKIRDG